MHTFEHKEQSFININGKDFFLIRGFQSQRGSWYFVQVTGKTPLKKEDLPNKNWELILTKKGKEKAYTAYSKTHLRYNTKQDSAKLVFIGGSTEGSYYLALSQIVRHFGLGTSEQHISTVATEFVSENKRHNSLSKLSDHGNSDCDAVLWELDSWFDEKDAKKLIGGDE